ncbi:unnamed protein product [Periconia digitata]|uniref:WW domain-containing protein n=1 Tax=Periconia digitata TaxID=1303443 RepID=A0A9W4XWL4_9PLEO|nr:unnamed protein product [Periconia digitata]
MDLTISKDHTRGKEEVEKSILQFGVPVSLGPSSNSMVFKEPWEYAAPNPPTWRDPYAQNPAGYTQPANPQTGQAIEDRPWVDPTARIGPLNGWTPQPLATPPIHSPALPPGWISQLDRNRGQYYYIHLPTQSTQWEFPKAATQLFRDKSPDSSLDKDGFRSENSNDQQYQLQSGDQLSTESKTQARLQVPSELSHNLKTVRQSLSMQHPSRLHTPSISPQSPNPSTFRSPSRVSTSHTPQIRGQQQVLAHTKSIDSTQAMASTSHEQTILVESPRKLQSQGNTTQSIRFPSHGPPSRPLGQGQTSRANFPTKLHEEPKYASARHDMGPFFHRGSLRNHNLGNRHTGNNSLLSSPYRGTPISPLLNTEAVVRSSKHYTTEDEIDFTYFDRFEDSALKITDPKQLRLEQVGIKALRIGPAQQPETNTSHGIELSVFNRPPRKRLSETSVAYAEDSPVAKRRRTNKMHDDQTSLGRTNSLTPFSTLADIDGLTTDTQSGDVNKPDYARLRPENTVSHWEKCSTEPATRLKGDPIQDKNPVTRSSQFITMPRKKQSSKMTSNTHEIESVEMELQRQIQKQRLEIERLKNVNEDLTRSSKEDAGKHLAPAWLTIHRVKYGKSERFYEDCPQWTWTGGRYRIEGMRPISKVKSFVARRKAAPTAFLVLHSYDLSGMEDYEPSDDNEIELIEEFRDSTHIQFLCRALASAFYTVLENNEILKRNVNFDERLGLGDETDLEDQENCPVITNMDVVFFHFRHLLVTAPDPLDESEGQVLRCFFDFLITEFGEAHQAATQSLAEGFVSMINLKYLFKREDIVVFSEEGRVWGAKLKSFPYTANDKMVVHTDSYQFDGKFSLRHEKQDLPLPHSIQKKQLTEIRSLPCYPLSFASSEIQQTLKKRGYIFWQCRHMAYVAYNGPNKEHDTIYTNTRFLVDVRTYQMMHGNKTLRYSPVNSVDEKTMSEKEPRADLVYMVPENIFGFDIQEKKWVNINVDGISSIQRNKNAFETLAIEEQSKELVNALVNNKINAQKATDMVLGKGNGLILLLHGGPGTGKTLTAESVAEIAEKPLYRVTCGDIGTEPRQVEEYLQKVFHLGKIWDCVVLLDEADVFLEQRTLADLTRNALVSVFLRTLEYYDGILILTSNRFGTFDEAFKSRIQLALHYKNLDRSQREHIWTNFIDRLKDLGEEFDDTGIRNKIKHLAKYEMNGRQIRNAITTARQLALFRKEDLNMDHLEHSIKVSGKFDKYLEEVHNQIKDDDMAREEGWR